MTGTVSLGLFVFLQLTAGLRGCAWYHQHLSSLAVSPTCTLFSRCCYPPAFQWNKMPPSDSSRTKTNSEKKKKVAVVSDWKNTVLWALSLMVSQRSSALNVVKWVCGGIFGLISAPDSKPAPVWNIFPCVILEVMYAPDKFWEQDYIWLFAIHVLFSVVLASFLGPSSFPRLNALLFSKACNGLWIFNKVT